MYRILNRSKGRLHTRSAISQLHISSTRGGGRAIWHREGNRLRRHGNRLPGGYGYTVVAGTRGYNSSASAEPFLSGSSGSYIDAMYESWQKDKTSVHKVRGAEVII